MTRNPSTPDPTRPARRAAAAAAILLAGAAFSSATSGPRGAPPGRDLPALVFVSRQLPGGDDRAQVPGVGPRGRVLAPGGRLLVREADGRLRELVPAGRFHDVADPAVSWDGTTIAFAAVEHADSAWRLRSSRSRPTYDS